MNIQSFGKASLLKIGELEKKIGFKLPEDYASFLLKNNGGVVNDSVFFVSDLSEKILFQVFFGLDVKSKSLDIHFWIKEYEGEIPDKSIVIGKDPGGNFILLVNSGKSPGIYYWDYNQAFSKSSEDSNTYFVAKSFTDFIESFKPV
jgi:hypothetical protein